MNQLEPTLFGKRLKELRESFGDTTVEFARRAGVDAACVNYYEKSPNANPTAAFLNAVCTNCGVSTDWLCGRCGEQSVMGYGVQINKLTQALMDMQSKMSILQEKYEALLEEKQHKPEMQQAVAPSVNVSVNFSDVFDKMFQAKTDEMQKNLSKELFSLKKDMDSFKEMTQKTGSGMAASQEFLHFQNPETESVITARIIKKVPKSKAKAVYQYKAGRMDERNRSEEPYVPEFKKNGEYNPTLWDFHDHGRMSTNMTNILRGFGIIYLQTAARMADSDLQKLNGMGPKRRDEFKTIMHGIYGIEIPNFHQNWKDDFIDVRLVDSNVRNFLKNRSIYTYRDLQDKALEMGDKLNQENKNVREWVLNYLDNDTKLALDHELERMDEER